MSTKSQNKIEEESAAPTNAMGNGAIATKDMAFGSRVVDVDDDTYHKCKNGKQKHARWAKFVSDPDYREQLKKEFKRGRRLLVRDPKGYMAYIRND